MVCHGINYSQTKWACFIFMVSRVGVGRVRWWVKVDEDVTVLTKNLIPVRYQSGRIEDLLITHVL